ncbi:MAG: hypothetical protein KKH61_20300 [Gammaproteobacteria bacterium]|nr:hypothetical protein [Gammaproteobacteria bacterium]
MINSTKLAKELIAAGITAHGNCNSNGVVWDDDNNDISKRADVKAVLAAHDPTPEPEPVNEVFTKPIVAPDFIVQSPKPKKNHLEAHAEAIAEAGKADKSIALIVLDLVVYIEELEKRLKKANI